MFKYDEIFMLKNRDKLEGINNLIKNIKDKETTDKILQYNLIDIANTEYYGGNKKLGVKIMEALQILESAQCTKTYKSLAQDVINWFKE